MFQVVITAEAKRKSKQLLHVTLSTLLKPLILLTEMDFLTAVWCLIFMYIPDCAAFLQHAVRVRLSWYSGDIDRNDFLCCLAHPRVLFVQIPEQWHYERIYS